MANKPDSEARALLAALCAWLTEDAKFMPDYVRRLPERFEAELRATSRATTETKGERK